MTAFKGGTVFIDVVPSMKGFFKDVAGEVKGQMPAVGNEAGRAYAAAFGRQGRRQRDRRPPGQVRRPPEAGGRSRRPGAVRGAGRGRLIRARARGRA